MRFKARFARVRFRRSPRRRTQFSPSEFPSPQWRRAHPALIHLILDEPAEGPSSCGVKTLSLSNLEARLEALYAAGSTPESITVSMEDWLDLAKRAKDKAFGNAIAGYTFAGVPVLIDKTQTAVVVRIR